MHATSANSLPGLSPDLYSKNASYLNISDKKNTYFISPCNES